MVKIRLKRMGAKKRPFYRLVVADSRSPRDGRFIELLGYYDPLPTPATVSIDAEKVREWLGKGARPSDAARALLVEQGILARSQRPVTAAPQAGAATDEPEPNGGASETPGASEEVDAVELPTPAPTAETAGEEATGAAEPVVASDDEEPGAGTETAETAGSDEAGGE